MGCLDDNQILAFVAGDLGAEERSAAAAHLDGCEPCRRLVAHAASALLPTGEHTVSPSTGLFAGDRVGRYEVCARLGGGAMGVVYAARHLDLQREVALKIARPDTPEGPQLRARLLREARAASAIRHPHVVTVHDVLTLDDGAPVIVMDRLEGDTLRARLAAGPLSIEQVLSVADQLLDALEAAHELGVIHRDLKPDNIFLEPNGIRVVDFGIAKLTALDGPTAETAGLTATGVLVGTPHYMAPEQAFADPEVDARADLWAVGAIIYECLCGRRPIEGDRTGQVLRNLARLEIVPLAERAPGVPTALAELVHGLLTECGRRPSSAREVRSHLGAIAAVARASDHRPLLPAVDGDAETLAVRSDSLEGHAASKRRLGRRRSYGWLAVGPALGLVAWLALTGASPPDAPAPAAGTRAPTIEAPPPPRAAPLPSPAVAPTARPDPPLSPPLRAPRPSRVAPLAPVARPVVPPTPPKPASSSQPGLIAEPPF